MIYGSMGTSPEGARVEGTWSCGKIPGWWRGVAVPRGNRCSSARKGEWPVWGTWGAEAAVVSGLGGFQSERWGRRESPVLTPGVFTVLVDLVPGISAAGEERCWGHSNPGTIGGGL